MLLGSEFTNDVRNNDGIYVLFNELLRNTNCGQLLVTHSSHQRVSMATSNPFYCVKLRESDVPGAKLPHIYQAIP